MVAFRLKRYAPTSRSPHYPSFHVSQTISPPPFAVLIVFLSSIGNIRNMAPVISDCTHRVSNLNSLVPRQRLTSCSLVRYCYQNHTLKEPRARSFSRLFTGNLVAYSHPRSLYVVGRLGFGYDYQLRLARLLRKPNVCSADGILRLPWGSVQL